MHVLVEIFVANKYNEIREWAIPAKEENYEFVKENDDQNFLGNIFLEYMDDIGRRNNKTIE